MMKKQQHIKIYIESYLSIYVQKYNCTYVLSEGIMVIFLYFILLLEIQFDTFDVATSPIYVVIIEGTDPFIKINQF